MVKLARIVNDRPEIFVTTTENEQDDNDRDTIDDDESDVYVNEGELLSCTYIENELENGEEPTNGNSI